MSNCRLSASDSNTSANVIDEILESCSIYYATVQALENEPFHLKAPLLMFCRLQLLPAFPQADRCEARGFKSALRCYFEFGRGCR